MMNLTAKAQYVDDSLTAVISATMLLIVHTVTGQQQMI